MLLLKAKKIKRKILDFKRRVLDSRVRKEVLDALKSKDEKILWIQSPEHGNLGDQMISIATEKFLKEKYSSKQLIEISLEQYNDIKNIIVKTINKNDIVIIHGGGNFGNLYLPAEIQRRDIVSSFFENKIIMMPQTMTFTKDKNGSAEFKKSKEIYSKHKNLTILCRENRTYNLAIENFENNNIVLCPDIVNYLEDEYISKNLQEERKGVLFCLRNDKEKIFEKSRLDEIKKILKERNVDYKLSDTMIKGRVTRENRAIKTLNLIKEMKESKLIITDRLHGMILSIITNTPVIVFNSYDGKVEESYKAWYMDYEYVFYCENESNVKYFIEKALTLDVKKSEFPTKEKLIESLLGL